jgi:1-acyl-sn-glycerol-3-phosphate acyltransferase
VLSRLIYNGYLLPQELAGVRKGLTTTTDLVTRGYSPLIYPEGRRTSNGELQEFRPGIGMLAVRLQLPVVPIRLQGLFEIYSINDSWPRRGPVRVVIGAPLRFSSDKSYADATRAIRNAVEKPK